MPVPSRFEKATLLVLLAGLLCSPVAAHLPFYEPQRLRNGNWLATRGFVVPAPEEDWSFQRPFDVYKESAEQPTQPNLPPTLRPNASVSVESILFGANDSDVFFFNKTFPGEVPLIAYPMVPACLRYLNFYPAISVVCPTNVIDSRTNETICPPPSNATLRSLPFDLPPGFGIRTVQQRPREGVLRPKFKEDQTMNEWLEPLNWTVACVTNWDAPECVAKWPTMGIYNWISNPGPYYIVLWFGRYVRLPRNLSVSALYQVRAEVGAVFGITDNYTATDFARLRVLAPFISRGATLSTPCAPVPDDMVIMD